MDKGQLITNVLPVDLFFTLQDNWEYCGWVLDNKSYEGDSICWGLGKNYRNDNLSWFKAATIIKLKCQKYIKRPIQLTRIHVNGQTRGQYSSFHYDTDGVDDEWSFILFSESHWDTQWGGEFVCLNPRTKKYEYFTYTPNCGALIPSSWQHYGQSPNQTTDEMRTTVAFFYKDSINLKKEIDDGSFNSRWGLFL